MAQRFRVVEPTHVLHAKRRRSLAPLTDDEVMRPASANLNTVKALEERGLIVTGKGGDPLKIVWIKEARSRQD